MNPDNGYISDYLIHWTGKNGDDEGSKFLGLIASKCQLLLSNNVYHEPDIFTKVSAKMVCFTDVPLSHAAQHCKRYGRFGIAFHKQSLLKVGAQPVFYVTLANRRDVSNIIKLLYEKNQTTTIESSLLDALKRHFYFMQMFSKGKIDNEDTFYYEREWRLGKQNLAPLEMWNRPDNPRYHIQEAGYSLLGCGKLFSEDGKEYFQFCESDVAFLISPRDWKARISNPHNFRIEDYEELVSHNPSFKTDD